MAFHVSGPLKLVRIENGRPVFDLPAAPRQSAAAPAEIKSAPSPEPARPAQPVRPVTARRSGPPNKFPGSCADCREWVEAGQGVRAKEGGRWVVRHKEACPQKQDAPAPAPRPEPTAPKKNRPVCTPDGKEPLTGYFTTVLEDGTWVTLRLRRQAENAKFAPGQILVAYLYGKNNEADYRRCAKVDDKGRAWFFREFQDNERLRTALAAVLGDQTQAGEAYARESKRCWRCGLHLTTPESLDRLMGKECWDKQSL